jgi:hypothetical protein
MVVGVVVDDRPVIIEGVGGGVRGGRGSEGLGEWDRGRGRRGKGQWVERIREGMKANGGEVAREGVIPVGGGPEVERIEPVGRKAQPPLGASGGTETGVVVDGPVRACVDQIEVSDGAGRRSGGEG